MMPIRLCLSFLVCVSSWGVAFTTALSNCLLPNIRSAVIIPGFLSGSDSFQPMVDILEGQYGIRTTIVPLTALEWIPCLGGRSVRPILERIDATVRHVAADLPGSPEFQYSLLDLARDTLTNPGGFLRVGGTDSIDEYPDVNPAGYFPKQGDHTDDTSGNSSPLKGKIALIGHSAGGWIGRIYCSDRGFGRPDVAEPYRGYEFVHSLITLGTPQATAPGPAFAGIAWCNREVDESDRLHRLAVAGSGYTANAWGSLTANAYAFCGFPDTLVDGDGITPVDSALAWEGAERLVVSNTTHFPWSDTTGASFVAPELTSYYATGKGEWYGSPSAVDQWVAWLLTQHPRLIPAASGSSTTATTPAASPE